MSCNTHKTSRAFPRSARLLTAADYSAVFASSRRYSDRHWTVLVKKEEGGQSRLGLAVAKKKAKRAVDRNRIKRIAREVFRHNAALLKGKELVIMNREAGATANCATLRLTLEKLISHASRS